MNRAIKATQNLLFECGLDSPLELPIEDIARARGVAEVQAIPINGAQGRIIFDGTEAIISYDNGINHEGKRRFVIAHELGHYELHRDRLDRIHTDNEQTLNEWYAKGDHEKEANEFASELLMPSKHFIDLVKGKYFNFGLIKNIAENLQVSITSALLKYRHLGDFPIAIIFCDEEKIRWTAFSDDFVLKFIRIGSNVPVNSVAYNFYNGDELPDEPEPVDPLEWFAEDFKLKHYKDNNFYEQCIRIGNQGVLSCIWND